MFRMFALAALAFVAGSTAVAQSSNGASNGPMIFDVRRSLPLEPNEPVYKDFYINAGPESGLKAGVYIAVVRPLPIHDPIQNKQQATLNVPVGHLQVIHVERGITVARLQDELTDDERPTLEFEGVMVGDRIDLGSLSSNAPKRPSSKKKSGGLFGLAIPTVAPTEALNATESSSVAPQAVPAETTTTTTPAQAPSAPAAAQPAQAPTLNEGSPAA